MEFAAGFGGERDMDLVHRGPERGRGDDGEQLGVADGHRGGAGSGDVDCGGTGRRLRRVLVEPATHVEFEGQVIIQTRNPINANNQPINHNPRSTYP